MHTWSYELANNAPENIRALVGDPLVVDTNESIETRAAYPLNPGEREQCVNSFVQEGCPDTGQRAGMALLRDTIAACRRRLAAADRLEKQPDHS